MAITEKALRAALKGDWAPIRSTPKTDLHAHLYLSAPFDRYSHYAGHPILPPPPRFKSLLDFLAYVRDNFLTMQLSVPVVANLLEDVLTFMANDGIIYTECSYDLAFPKAARCSWEEIISAATPILHKLSERIRFAPELGISRDNPWPDWYQMSVSAIETGFFKSIDIYGAELERPIDYFLPILDVARQNGLKVKFHIGEVSPAERLIEEVKKVKPDAIQHGFRAAENPEAIALLADLGIEVNVCPWSNYLLSCVERYEQHPIRKLFDGGVKVTINTDDYAIFGRSVSEEYVKLFECGLFTAKELETIRLNGLSVAGSAFV